MAQLSNAFTYAYAIPADLRSTPASRQTPEVPVAVGTGADQMAEERWPLGLSVAFVIASSILLWLPIITGIRWLLAAF